MTFQEPLLDDKLSEKYLGQDKTIINIARKAYYESYKDESNRMCDLFIKKDYENLELIVHKIKGSSYYVGSKELYDLSYYILCELRHKSYNIECEMTKLCKLNEEIVEEIRRMLSL